MNVTDVRITDKQVLHVLFGQVVQFCIGVLLFYAPDDRRSQYDISNWTETDDKNLHEFKGNDMCLFWHIRFPDFNVLIRIAWIEIA